MQKGEQRLNLTVLTRSGGSQADPERILGPLKNEKGANNDPTKIHTATFWHPQAAGRRKKVVLEGAWKINRNLDRILIGIRMPGKAKIIKQVF